VVYTPSLLVEPNYVYLLNLINNINLLLRSIRDKFYKEVPVISNMVIIL